MKRRRNVVPNTSPWESRYVGDLIEELERSGRISASTAERARRAAAEGRYRDALDAALDLERSGDGSDHADDPRRTDGGLRPATTDR